MVYHSKNSHLIIGQFQLHTRKFCWYWTFGCGQMKCNNDNRERGLKHNRGRRLFPPIFAVQSQITCYLRCRLKFDTFWSVLFAFVYGFSVLRPFNVFRFLALESAGFFVLRKTQAIRSRVTVCQIRRKATNSPNSYSSTVL